jgi:predicted lipoprotein
MRAAPDEPHVAGHADMIIDYATARRQSGPISTGTVIRDAHHLVERARKAPRA